MAKVGLIELVDSFAFTIDTLKFAAAEQRYHEFLSKLTLQIEIAQHFFIFERYLSTQIL